MSALCLGTAQFGLNYGISNRAGQVGPAEAERILKKALLDGVHTLDTAPAYGTAEEVLGQFIAGTRFSVISKTPQFRRAEITAADADAVRQSLETSLRRLGAPALGGLLVHWPGDLLAPGADHIYRALSDAKDAGLTAGIGASVYEPDEVFAVLDRYAIDLLQVPLNVLDQRMVTSGALTAAKARGVTVHARSAFLQGLLLMDEAVISEKHTAARPAVARFRRAAAEAGLSPIVAALGYPASVPELDFIVCGVTSVPDFDEINASLGAARGAGDRIDYIALAEQDPDVIDPRRWPQ